MTTDAPPLTCPCPGWQEGMPQITGTQQLAYVHGIEYTGMPFNFCPWCGRELTRKKTRTKPTPPPNELVSKGGEVKEKGRP